MASSEDPVKPRLQYPFPDRPELGRAIEVGPGVFWMRMPLPFALDHINVWAIDDGPGWAIVDTGVQTPDVLEAWKTLLAGDLGGRPVTRVIATHMHPDHIGMAGWLTRRYQCRLWMTRTEYLTCRVLVADTGREAPPEAMAFYRRAGWDDEALEFYRTRFGGFGKHVYALPDGFRRMQAGERITIGANEWQVVVGNGHSPEHACLHCPGLGLLISGDQVLPRISSNVSVFPTEPEANPLHDWLASIDRLRATIDDQVLVLPSHNEPFRGLHARLDALARGHAIGLERLQRTLVEPRRVVDTFGALFARPIRSTSSVFGMATGEALAHLNYLLARGAATVEEDADGVAWWQAA